MKIASPIIIIGNARSGSSLLRNIFSAHPNIVMFGELRFAVARIWQAMSEVFQHASAYRLMDYFDNDPKLYEELANTPSLMQKAVEQLEPDREARRGDIVRRAISEALSLDGRCQTYWGYKEITNAGEVDWSIYDSVFPSAWYVHVVRDPQECLRSAIWHERLQLNDDTIVQCLSSWTSVFKTSRLRSASGRYYEIHYEDLIANPEETLSPFLNAIEAGWDRRCGEAVRQQVGARSERFEMPAHLHSLIAAVPELPAIMNEFGYPQAALVNRGSRGEIGEPRLVPIEDGRWRLDGPIWPEEGLAWQFDLNKTHLGAELAAISDDVDVWARSPLRLFEDEQPLGPPHALHRLVRERGGGSYSHWQTRLIFSTSDNSDPNTNGRTYTFDRH